MAHRVRRRHLNREQTLTLQTASAENTLAPSAEIVLAQARHVGHHFARMNQTAGSATAVARKPRQEQGQEAPQVRREAEPDANETASPTAAGPLADERETVANRDVSRETVHRDGPAGAPPAAAPTAAPTTIVRSLFQTSVVSPLQQAHDLLTPFADETALQTASNKMNQALNSLTSLQAPIRAQKDESQLMRIINLSNLVSTYQQHVQVQLGNTMPVRQVAAQISPLSGPMHARIARINALLREAGKPRKGSAADPQVAIVQAMFHSGVVGPLHTAHSMLITRKPDVTGAIEQEQIAYDNLSPLPGIIRGTPQQEAAPDPTQADPDAEAQPAPEVSSETEAVALVFEDLGTLTGASASLLMANTGDKFSVEDIASGMDPQGGGDVTARITGIEAGFDALDAAAKSNDAPTD